MRHLNEGSIRWEKQEDLIMFGHLGKRKVNLKNGFKHAVEELQKAFPQNKRSIDSVRCRWYIIRHKAPLVVGAASMDGVAHNIKNQWVDKITGEIPEYKQYPLIEMIAMFMALTEEERNAVLLIIKPKS